MQVLLKGDEGILEVISTYVTSVKADLLVTGSQNLCIAGKFAPDNQQRRFLTNPADQHAVYCCYSMYVLSCDKCSGSSGSKHKVVTAEACMLS